MSLLFAGLSVSGAIFLIVEMYEPFGGLIEISSGSLHAALTQLGQIYFAPWFPRMESTVVISRLHSSAVNGLTGPPRKLE